MRYYGIFKERMIEMKFEGKDLRKYEMSTSSEKLTYLCIMLEKIVDDNMAQPQVIVVGDVCNPLSSQGVTREYTLLEEKYLDLKEMLRWHSTDEKPRLETINCSVDVVLKLGDIKYLAYYNYNMSAWVVFGEVIKQDGIWCYIPEVV